MLRGVVVLAFLVAGCSGARSLVIERRPGAESYPPGPLPKITGYPPAGAVDFMRVRAVVHHFVISTRQECDHAMAREGAKWGADVIVVEDYSEPAQGTVVCDGRAFRLPRH